MSAKPLHLFDRRGLPPYAKRHVETVQLSARFTDPDTSVKAAQSITPGRTERMILEVFAEAQRVGYEHGYTDDEIVVLEPLRRVYEPTVKSARSRLSKAGLLVDSGERRDSMQGRPMIVWVLA